MLSQDERIFCHELISLRLARYGYDVYSFTPIGEGESFSVKIMSLATGRRDISLIVFEDAVWKTYQDGELAEAITLNLDDALRHIRAA